MHTRRLVVRVLGSHYSAQVMYGEEWAQSFTDAFGDSTEVRQAISVHNQDVAAAAALVPAELDALVRECLPIPVPPDLAAFVECTVEGADDSVGIGDGRNDSEARFGNGVDHGERKGASVDGSSKAVGASVLRADRNVMGGTAGGVWSTAFLSAVQPLYDLHMGVEHMAPLLYTLIR